MREITPAAIIVFFSLFISAIVLAALATWFGHQVLPLGAFTGVVYSLLFIILLYLIAILCYRFFLLIYPLNEGVIAEGSKEEFSYQVYLLFYLFLFNSLINIKILPVALMRLVYIMLGAKLGDNSFCNGVILDPPFTFVGNNTLMGQDCLIYAHAIEGRNLSYAVIKIGNNVTIGAKAVIMPGVRIGDGAIVGACALVSKGTIIGKKEVWVGIPAKKIKTISDN